MTVLGCQACKLLEVRPILIDSGQAGRIDLGLAYSRLPNRIRFLLD